MKARLARHALLAALVTAGAFTTYPASADRGFPGHGGRFHAPAPHVWNHGHGGGHWNGWWIVGAPLLLYPPLYSYPQPVVQPLPTPLPDLPPSPQSWYYCDSAQAYYPYVQSCAEGWRSVPAAPPGNTQPAPAEGQNWYYCDSAKGYYPYVQRCPESWRPVPATPTPKTEGASKP